MEPNKEAAKRKMQLDIEATAEGKALFGEDNYLQEFNRGCDHIAEILSNSHKLFKSGSYATSTFLAITAIEEIAKIEIAAFRYKSSTTPVHKRREDHLYSHKAKHSIALQEVIAIGERLPKAIGEARVRELLNMAESGELIQLREASLYTDVVDDRFVTPSERVSKDLARDILLLALEVWDDRLVGLTDHTYEIDKEMRIYFRDVENS